MGAGAITANMPAFTAEQLVTEAQTFSQEAWAHIYDNYYPKLFQYCYLRTGNRATSEDLASEVFLEALRGIRRYRYRGVSLQAWLYRIAHNLTVDYLDRRSRQATVPIGEEARDPHFQVPDEGDRLALREDVQSAIHQLTDDQQIVITLRFFQGLSHDEIGVVMGRRAGAVRGLQHRALTALRQFIAA